MSSSKLNILLIDPEEDKNSGIVEILEGDDYQVLVVDSEDMVRDALKTFNPRLILCRRNEQDIIKESYSSDIIRMSSELNVPVVIITPIMDADFHIKCLAKGLIYSITTPVSKKFFLEQISHIINDHDCIEGSDNTLHLTFPWQNEKITMEVSETCVANFIHSLARNSAHHSQLLRDLLKNEQVAKMPLCANLFDEKGACSDNDIRTRIEFKRALNDDEFTIYYQPIISLNDDSYTGFEALIRWNHPERGLISPEDFISAVENSDMVVPIGFWVINRVARDICNWSDRIGNDNHFCVSINLSAHQFVFPDLSEQIVDITDEYSIAPDRIAFEITEHAFMTNMEMANMQLLKLKSRNHLIYLDDFGTGYSSLSYLQHFPVDVLKIDKSFVQWMHIDEQSQVIVRTVIALAHNLGMKVVAEGVEEAVHTSMLKELGCDYGQGYLYSKPLSAVSLIDFLDRHFSR